ncbi:YbaN family protein [Oceanimonas sp. CHS3-5]|uniref:YbaN family protein n=1 Tax=Oceanimonas sp. CHS3-5 TaxID=3068186 RepID=UPI00273F71B3|nr:YbaN family protein [Oceanimonas sp. CHS3-5]MDP5291086.1 YbaN family protein [Oceanimonas sp. CHS3-5]
MRILFALLGGISLGLGVLGAFLPVLPTTPFVLLSAFCFGRSSPRVHHWLVNHRWFGGMIQDWQTHRGLRLNVRRRALWLMAASFALSIYLVPTWWVRGLLVLTFIALVCWMRRLPVVPERPVVAMEQTRP